MDKKRQSKDMLRQEKQKIIDKIRELDLEIATGDITDYHVDKLSWDNGIESEERNKRRKELETELEEIHRKLGGHDLA